MSGRHDGTQLQKGCQGNVFRQAWKVIKHIDPPVHATHQVCQAVQEPHCCSDQQSMEVAVACSSIRCDLVHAFARICDELHPVIACVKRGFFWMHAGCCS